MAGKMMTLWRISNYADLSGEGAKLASGRWHTKGIPVVYLAETPAGSLLERLVHLFDTHEQLPRTYNLLKIEAPDDLAVEELLPLADVNWKEQEEFTRQLGDAWLAARETSLARVPSAIAPYTWNYLLNPAHPDAGRVKIISATRERFDNRLFHAEPR